MGWRRRHVKRGAQQCAIIGFFCALDEILVFDVIRWGFFSDVAMPGFVYIANTLIAILLQLENYAY